MMMMHSHIDMPAEVKASGPIRTSLYEREGSMWGSLKRPSPRRSMVDECRSDASDFCMELAERYGFSSERVAHAAERYKLGRSRSGKVIFWMIDEAGVVRDGHIGDGWVSEMLKRRCPELAVYVKPQHCLFGQHLLNGDDGHKPVGIVSSERAAVILSEARPELLWLAGVYTLNMTIDRLECLKGRRVTLYPRTDPDMEYYMGALELADQARRTYSLNVRVSSLLEDRATAEQKQAEIDLSDFLFQPTKEDNYENQTLQKE